ncbi:hypothetical protein Tco_1553858 [Tanacetum coccineum]
MKIQAGIQVSRPGELKRQLQLWKCFGRLYSIVFVLVKNIVISFLGSLPVPLKHVNWKPGYKGSYTKEEEATGQWPTEIRLTDPYGNIYLQGFTTMKTDRKLSKYNKLSDIMSPNIWEHRIMRPEHQDLNALDNMKSWTRYCSHKFIMSSCYRKDAIEMRSLELCHEFYSTFEFDKVCAYDELQTKKIIKFRLGGHAYNLTLLEFASRLGLYHADELEEDGFNIYFKGDDVVRSLSALIYYRDLDTTPLRDLIDSEGRLIPENLQPGVPRVGIPRPPRASMQDLYDRIAVPTSATTVSTAVSAATAG